MDLFWKASAAGLIATVLVMTLGKRDISLALMMAACCMIATVGITYLEPVMDLLRQLEEMIQMEQGLLSVLLKAAGIGAVAEISSIICTDGGAGSLGKTLQFLGSAAILCLSVPLFQSLLSLIQEILGQV